MSAKENCGPHLHPQAIVESAHIGPGTSVGAFTRICPGAVVGSDSTVAEHVHIADDVVLGDRVSVQCGVQLWGGMRVADGVSIGPNATFSMIPSPQLRKANGSLGAVTCIGMNAIIGANATIMLGLTIGRNALVYPGTVVTHDVPAYAVVAGNPSQITGYVDASAPEREPNTAIGALPGKLRIDGAALIEIPKVVDMRGMTTFAEIDKHLPFLAKRFFVVTGVPSREVRGEHAHKALHEFLVCLKGSFAVMLDDGVVRDEVLMDSPTMGLHVPPQVWRVVYKFSSDAVMLSLCSHVYDPEDYIRDYASFRTFVGKDLALS
jgi:UDP-2-acetamido-3-amino-2,3-dideoxy-glucuronate N-acetyltransferase